MAAKPKRKPERLPLRIVRGGMEPADVATRSKLRERSYTVGDIVFATITKPRNPRFHRLVHAFGLLLADNLDAFTGMDAHKVLKRLQIEANIGCDEVALNFPGIGPCTYRVPRSLSFESMDDGEFAEVFKGFCRYVCSTYWPTMTPEKVEQMALMMGDS